MWDELDVERAKAEADLEKADADLHKAETDYDKAAIDRANAKADGDSAHSIAALDKARARRHQARACWRRAQLRHDQLHTALAELNRAQSIDRSQQKRDYLAEASMVGPELRVIGRPSERDARQRPTQSGAYMVRNQEGKELNDSQGTKFAASVTLFRRTTLVPRAARRSRARLIVMLLALALAYLQYYLIDVNLQIALLPRIDVYS